MVSFGHGSFTILMVDCGENDCILVMDRTCGDYVVESGTNYGGEFMTNARF